MYKRGRLFMEFGKFICTKCSFHVIHYIAEQFIRRKLITKLLRYKLMDVVEISQIITRDKSMAYLSFVALQFTLN